MNTLRQRAHRLREIAKELRAISADISDDKICQSINASASYASMAANNIDISIESTLDAIIEDIE